MYIYINNQGKITTQIEHGAPVRQGNRLRLVVCFSLDNEIAMNASGLSAKFRLIDKSEEWGMEYDFPNPHINEFEKLKSSEIVYDLVPGEHYLMFEKIFDVNEFTTLYHGELQCILTLRQQNGLEYSGYIQDRLEINVAKTYGSYIPVPEITKEEYDELMTSILSKLDHTGGNANYLTVNNGRYFGTQEFRNTNVLIKDAESAYEPTSLQQVVGLINTNNETVIEDKLSEKVDKISGKGLSTNDFTNQYKQKLDRLENYDDTDLKHRIFAVETENTAQNLEINNVQNDINSTKSSLDDLNSEFNYIKQDISSIYAKNNAQDSEISSIKSKNTEQDTEISNIKIKNNTQDTEINSIRENLTNVSEEFEDVKEIVENVENSVSGYDSLIENLNKNVSQYDNRITSLENTNKSQDSEISNNKKNITTNTNNISSIQSSITNLTSKNASQDTEINTLKGNVQTNTNALKTKADLVNGKIPSSQLPSFVDDVLEYSNKSSFPSTGESGKIYIDLANNTTYRWSGSTYVAIGSSLALGETSSTAYPGNKGKELADSVANINAKDKAQDNRLTELEDNYENISASVGTNRADINNLINDLSGIDEIVKTHDETINGLNDNINNNSTKNQEQDTRLTSLESDVAALKEGGSGGSEDLSDVLSDIADLQELTNKHDTHIADLEGTVTTIQQSDVQQNQAIQTVINQLGTTTGNVSTLTERTDILQRNKADRLSGQVINDKFYTRVTASDSTNSKYEIIEDMGSIQKIGGMSYKSENLSPQSNTAPLSTGHFNTTQGTFGYVKRGKEYVFSAYYISSSVTNIGLGLRAMSDRDGTTIIGNLSNITLTTGKRTSIRFNAQYSGYIGLTGSNFTATDTLSDITLNEGSTDLGYTPYFSGLRDTKVAALTSTGDNLLVFDDIPETTKNGITYSVKDGVFYYTGTASARVDINVNLKTKLILNGTYWFALFNNTVDNCGFRFFNDNTLVKGLGHSMINQGYAMTWNNQPITSLNLMIESGKSMTNATVSPMIIVGSTKPAQFEQGWMDMVTIPNEVQQLDDYGVGMDDEYYNYVDFQNKKFVRNVTKQVINGTENWSYLGSQYDTADYVCFIVWGDSTKPKHLATAYNSGLILANQGFKAGFVYGTSVENQIDMYTNGTEANSRLMIKVIKSFLSTYDVNGLKQFLTNNPITIIYPLANPEEYDLSHLKLDSVYRVSNMGSETLENEYKQKAPSEILYGVDIVPQVIENSDNISKVKKDVKYLQDNVAYKDQLDVINTKADKYKGEIVEESFYSRPTGSHFEITDETGSIMKLGGMSYKSSNLLVFDDVERTVLSGITYRVDNGVIYLTGTATAAASVKLPLTGIGSGSYYLKWEISGTTDKTVFGYLYNVGHTTQLTLLNTASVFKTPLTLTQEVGDFTLYWQSGAVISNLALKPILVKGSTEPTTWEKGFKGIRNAKVTAISSIGANLLNHNSLITKDGTFKKQSDKSYISKALGSYGTAYFNCSWNSSVGAMTSVDGIPLKKGTYYISFKAKLNSGTNAGGLGISITLENNKNIIGGAVSNPTISSYYQEYKRTFTLSVDESIGFIVQSAGGATSAVIQIKDIMIASEDIEYEPYWEDITEIPQEIQDLDSYGCGINEDYYNYVDFQNKKFVKKVQKVVLDGSNDEIWSMNTADNGNGIANFGITLSSLGLQKYITNGITDWYIANRTEQITIQSATTDDGVYVNETMIYVRVKSTTANTIALLRTYLASNPVEVVYVITTPIETDISNIKLNQVYRVNNLGIETLVNDYKLSAPTSILYGVNITPQVIENSNDIASLRDEMNEMKQILKELNTALEEDY